MIGGAAMGPPGLDPISARRQGEADPRRSGRLPEDRTRGRVLDRGAGMGVDAALGESLGYRGALRAHRRIEDGTRDRVAEGAPKLEPTLPRRRGCWGRRARSAWTAG